MKITDDYQAKLKIWAVEQKVHPLPPFKLSVKFSPQKFNSLEEMHAWKRELLLQHVRNQAQNQAENG